MDIEESEQKMNQAWSLLDSLVDIFEKNEEGAEFSEYENTPITGIKVVNTAYLLILRNGGMRKSL